MTDLGMKLASIAVTAALLLGLTWFAWRRGQFLPLAAINGAVALVILVTAIPEVRPAISYGEWHKLLLFAFEASVLLLLVLFIAGVRLPVMLIVLQAVVNLLLAAGLALFLFTFRITRLF